eukprot:m.88673 g.88673  ORF g.88673 m.88673 type:complete len:490 (-) comp8378_c1_seq2:805-2274(-)
MTNPCLIDSALVSTHSGTSLTLLDQGPSADRTATRRRLCQRLPCRDRDCRNETTRRARIVGDGIRQRIAHLDGPQLRCEHQRVLELLVPQQVREVPPLLHVQLRSVVQAGSVLHALDGEHRQRSLQQVVVQRAVWLAEEIVQDIDEAGERRLTVVVALPAHSLEQIDGRIHLLEAQAVAHDARGGQAVVGTRMHGQLDDGRGAVLEVRDKARRALARLGAVDRGPGQRGELVRRANESGQIQEGIVRGGFVSKRDPERDEREVVEEEAAAAADDRDDRAVGVPRGRGGVRQAGLRPHHALLAGSQRLHVHAPVHRHEQHVPVIRRELRKDQRRLQGHDALAVHDRLHERSRWLVGRLLGVRGNAVGLDVDGVAGHRPIGHHHGEKLAAADRAKADVDNVPRRRVAGTAGARSQDMLRRQHALARREREHDQVAREGEVDRLLAGPPQEHQFAGEIHSENARGFGAGDVLCASAGADGRAALAQDAALGR